MLISVVMITRNEAPRLRLTLESFRAQDLGADDFEMEIVVVDDASTDETPDVLREAARGVPLQIVRNAENRGRSPSRNEGVRRARGEIAILFDGDCLASPDLVARHGALHRARSAVIGRGETYHLRSTRFFRDPETGSPNAGSEEHVRRMGDQLRAALVTRDDVRARFPALAARAEPGIYAGAGPRRLYELEMRALHTMPGASILWMTAAGQNLSLRRSAFEAVGGFDERLTLNEHRELAFRLAERGVAVAPVDGARSFHMLHRTDWRDPLDDVAWEQIFYEAHPCLAVKLMNVFWLSLSRNNGLPPEASITSLEQLESIVRAGSTFDYDSLRSSHPKLINL